MLLNLSRWLRHGFGIPGAVRRAFPEEDLQRIQQAIGESETRHTGEIRFAIEAALPWSYLRRNAPLRQRATMVFSKLHVWDTEANNGVLIYVCLADHGIEIVADRGIARHVPDARWQSICAAMRDRFRAGDFADGVIEAVAAIGAHLAEHFPVRDARANLDELPNKPAVL